MFNVLIVEDEKAAKNLLISLFESVGEYSIISSFQQANGVAEYLNEHPVDLLCLDIGLPGINGIELLKSLARTDIYTIFITGEASYASEAFDLGAVDYIRKPVTRERLIDALGRFEAFRRGEDRMDIDGMLRSQFNLTGKEAEICSYVKGGYVKEEICQVMSIGSGTLKTHLNHIYDKILYKDNPEARKKGRTDSYARLLYFLYNL